MKSSSCLNINTKSFQHAAKCRALTEWRRRACLGVAAFPMMCAQNSPCWYFGGDREHESVRVPLLLLTSGHLM